MSVNFRGPLLICLRAIWGCSNSFGDLEPVTSIHSPKTFNCRFYFHSALFSHAHLFTSHNISIRERLVFELRSV